MDITIYHNPACGTSRNTLALIRAAGFSPLIVEYLKNPPAREELLRLSARAGVNLRFLLREKEKLAGELGLLRPEVGDEALVEAMLAHPVLINRPIVETPMGVKLCRPAELVREVLPASGAAQE